MAAAIAPSPAAIEVPMVDLREALALAEPAIHRNLEQLHARGQYILGPQTAAFESAFAAATGAAFAVGVGTGTSALELCLRAAEVTGPDVDVIVPSMTSLFTAQAVLAVGARLRIADVGSDDLLLTAEELEQAWTPQTRAVIAVHLYGQPCRLDEIAQLCAARGAVLIQDACQAHGARFRGLPLNHFSPFCAYSFYPTKNLGALGDGGAITTDDPAIASRLRLLRDGGRAGDQVCRTPGVNSRLDEFQACYLNAFLPFLNDWNQRRRQLSLRYQQALAQSATPMLRFDEDSVNHLAVIRSSHRDHLRQHLSGCGIQTSIHYPVPLHEQPGLQPWMSWAQIPQVAARAAREILSLPAAPHVTDEMADAVLKGIRTFTP